MKIKQGDRLKLSGGYDLSSRLKWLKDNEFYLATILDFINGGGDHQFSVLIEFDDEMEFEGLKGKYGLIDTRYVGQKWKEWRIVHVHLIEEKFKSLKDRTKENSRWIESHAIYSKI